MSKKFLTIFSSLILVCILSISCSNADKTGSGDSGNGNSTGGDSTSTIDPSKGIEQFNGNIYVSAKTYTIAEGNLNSIYFWVSVKDGKITLATHNSDVNAPQFDETSYIPVSGSGADYNIVPGNAVEGTFKFTDNSVTVKFTKFDDAPSILNQDIVCNKK